MNREKLQSLASEWVRMAKNDIRTKIMDFMREVDTTKRELAYALAISEGELEQILNGNGEITLTTFAKLLIATGNALEIKPIEETPIGDFENFPCEEFCPTHIHAPNHRVAEEFAREARENVFNDFSRTNNRPHFVRPNITRGIDFGEFDFPHMRDNRHNEDDGLDDVPQPRDERGRFVPRHRHSHEVPSANPSPFATMSRDEMIKIITDRLWDTEIDLANSSNAQIARFLEDKNKRIQENKRVRELEADPSVIAFKNKLKESVNNNPHLRDWVQRFASALSEE